jgi:hypothetical protein
MPCFISQKIRGEQGVGYRGFLGYQGSSKVSDSWSCRWKRPTLHPSWSWSTPRTVSTSSMGIRSRGLGIGATVVSALVRLPIIVRHMPTKKSLPRRDWHGFPHLHLLLCAERSHAPSDRIMSSPSHDPFVLSGRQRLTGVRKQRPSYQDHELCGFVPVWGSWRLLGYGRRLRPQVATDEGLVGTMGYGPAATKPHFVSPKHRHRDLRKPGSSSSRALRFPSKGRVCRSDQRRPSRLMRLPVDQVVLGPTSLSRYPARDARAHLLGVGPEPLAN